MSLSSKGSPETASSPDKLIPSIPDQLYTAGSPTPDIQQITPELDKAEFDDDDHHCAEKGCSENLGVELALEAG